MERPPDFKLADPERPIEIHRGVISIPVKSGDLRGAIVVNGDTIVFQVCQRRDGEPSIFDVTEFYSTTFENALNALKLSETVAKMQTIKHEKRP